MASRAKKQSTNIVVWIILLLLIVGLAGFGTTNFGGNVRAIGSVGDTEIGVNRYARALDQELRAVSAETGQQVTLTQAQQLGIDANVRQRLIATAALESETSRLGLSVGDVKVAEQIRDISSFQGVDGSFDREAYEFTLDRNGMNVAQFENEIRTETARTLLQGAVLGGVRAPAPYVDTLIEWVGERRDFSWIALDQTNLEEQLPEPTEEDLTAQYEATPDAYTRPSAKQITYAWLSPDFILDDVEVEEEAVRSLYEDRSEEFRQAERRLVERLVFGSSEEAAEAKARIDAGDTTFEQLVSERGLSLSDTDMGDATRQELGSAADPVFALEEPGLVGPVETSLGPAIIRMNGILAASETPFEEVEDQLSDELASERARRQIADRIDSIDDLLAGGATLEDLAKETSMQLGTIEWSPGMTEGIAAYTSFSDAADAVQEGDFPEVNQLEDGGIFALRLDEVLPERLVPFEEVRDQVVTDWRAAEAQRRLVTQAEDLKAQVEAGTDISELGLPANAEEGITRDQFIEGTPRTFLRDVFAMEPGQTQIVTGSQSVILVTLSDAQPPAEGDPDIEAVAQSLRQEAAQGLSQDMLQAFTSAVQSDMGISLNQSAINAVHAQFP